jgi:hypothetical protein
VCAAADTQEPDVAASFELMATGYSPESNLLARCAGPGRATPGGVSFAKRADAKWFCTCLSTDARCTAHIIQLRLEFLKEQRSRRGRCFNRWLRLAHRQSRTGIVGSHGVR